MNEKILKLKRNWHRGLIGLGLSMLLFALGIHLIQLGNLETENNFYSVFTLLIGCSLIIFFGFLTILMIVEFARPNTVLEIQEDGLLINNGILGMNEMMKWDELKSSKISVRKNEEYLLIYSNNPKQIIDKSRKYKKWNLIKMMKLFQTPISIKRGAVLGNIRKINLEINNRVIK